MHKVLHLSNQLHEKQDILGALFPEIYYQQDINEYSSCVIKKFNIRRLRDGDQTLNILKATNEIIQDKLTQGHIDSGNNIKVIEELNSRSAVRFLASHYYYHAMFKWFWTMYKQYGEHDNSILYHQAAEVSYFENSSMEIVKQFIEYSLKYSNSNLHIQRLWHQLSVFYALRGETSNARDAIIECEKLLQYVSDEEEKQCRLAEYYNTFALIYMKEKK